MMKAKDFFLFTQVNMKVKSKLIYYILIDIMLGLNILVAYLVQRFQVIIISIFSVKSAIRIIKQKKDTLDINRFAVEKIFAQLFIGINFYIFKLEYNIIIYF